MLKRVLCIYIMCVLTACISRDSNPPAGLDTLTMHPGDILFRCGNSIQSRAVLHADHGHYSHVGVAVSVNNEIMVAHAVPAESKGDPEILKIDSLNIFFSPDRAQSGAVARLKLSKIEQRAIDSLAQTIVARGVPFDHDYNLGDDSKIYCTELLWILYNSIDQDITCGERANVDLGIFSRELILPSTIYNNRELQIIWSFDRATKY